MDVTEQRFPDNFRFGAATAAYQVEGGNVNSDWWRWERQPGTPCREPSGDACDFYHRYREDIAMLAGFGLDTFRLSIEWARIEPVDSEFSPAALDHYRRVLATCREFGVSPVVTFQHFTLPQWLQDLGGFGYVYFPDVFERYCSRAARALNGLFDTACTINEPEVVAIFGYFWGDFPPGRKSDLSGMDLATDNLLSAHRRAALAIRDEAAVPAGITLALQEIVYEAGAEPGDSPPERWSRISDRFLETAKDDDFVGVQTYTRTRIAPQQRQTSGSARRVRADETDSTTQMGYEYAPEALGATIRRAWRQTEGTPILVTENGIATANDERRIAFIRSALGEVLTCLANGIQVKGYLYWSLLDNFEWALGYDKTFGLVAVDRRTFARRPRPSAYWLGEVARTRVLL